MKNFIPFVSVTVAAMYIGLGEALPSVCNSRMVEVQNKIGPGPQGPQTDRYSVMFRRDFSKPPCQGLLSAIAKNDGLHLEDNGKPINFVGKWGKHPL
ncbi:unnamed protein product [Brassica rapa]|uniref:Uncharacterized protein n=2 Tax=Brassica TaxID=3705 RepID=A0A8D9G9D0_BRACM|nr:unnamed protein product [Brassica napus]CAG7872896.1 unnamed protein product [Brassica rapa]